MKKAGAALKKPGPQRPRAAAARQDLEKLRVIAETSFTAIAIHDKGIILAVNQAAADVFGYSISELAGKSILDFITPNSVEAVRKSMASKEGKAYEFTARRKDGSVFPAEGQGKEISYLGKRVRVVTIKDISERKLAEKFFKESGELYRAFMSACPDAVAILDLKGRLFDVSRKYVEMFGFESEKELIGADGFERVFPEDREKVKGIFPVLLKEGFRQNHQYRLVRKDGSTFIGEFSSAVIKNLDNSPKTVISIIRDITDRKRAEDAVRDAAELYQAFMKVSPDAVFLDDLQGRFMDVSQKAAQMFGYDSPEELKGKTIFDLNAQEENERAEKQLSLLLSTGAKLMSQYKLRRKDGSTFFGEISSAVLKDLDNSPKTVISIIRDITDRKRAEDAVKESAELYQAFMKVSPDAVAISDLKGMYLDSSQNNAEIFGYQSPQEIIGKYIREFMAPEEIERSKEIFYGLIRKGGWHRGEYKLKRKDGSVFIGEVSNAVIRDAQGNPKAVIGITRDVTERNKMQNAIHEKMEYYQKLMMASPDPIIVTDLNGDIIEFSERVSQYYGTENVQKLIGVNSMNLIAPEDRERARINLEKTITQGFSGSVEYKINRPDGTSYIAELSAALIKDAEGRPKAFIATLHDITERRAAEDALRESEQQYRITFDSMSDMIHVLDPEFRILLFNTAFQKFNQVHGLETRVVGKKIFDVFPFLTEEVLKEYQQVISSGKTLITEETNLIQGETFITETRKIPIIEKGKVARVITVIRDITQMKVLEENLAKADKLESLGILAGGIAHDFNNILTAIVGNISIAKLGCEGHAAAYQNLDEAEKAAMRAKDLTQQLLTFSRGGAPIKKTLCVAELIQEAAGFILRGSKSRCEFSKCDQLQPIEADESQMDQVFHNLLINADQAMPNGGTIKVNCENADLIENNELNLSPGKYVKISVQDQGVGIPEEYHLKIFDPYFTTKQEGSGLGLTIAYSIVIKHGGHISLDSEPGHGSTFTVYLPASENKLPPPTRKDEKESVSRGKVLVMDDDAGIRRVAGNMLQNLGYQVESAKDGGEAIDLFLKARDAGSPFDLVIMDLVVPSGMGGKEAMKKLREIDPGIKSVVSSGYSTDPIMADYNKHGFDAVITKPYGLKKLREVLLALGGPKKN